MWLKLVDPCRCRIPPPTCKAPAPPCFRNPEPKNVNRLILIRLRPARVRARATARATSRARGIPATRRAGRAASATRAAARSDCCCGRRCPARSSRCSDASAICFSRSCGSSCRRRPASPTPASGSASTSPACVRRRRSPPRSGRCSPPSAAATSRPTKGAASPGGRASRCAQSGAGCGGASPAWRRRNAGRRTPANSLLKREKFPVLREFRRRPRLPGQ